MSEKELRRDSPEPINQFVVLLRWWKLSYRRIPRRPQILGRAQSPPHESQPVKNVSQALVLPCVYGRECLCVSASFPSPCSSQGMDISLDALMSVQTKAPILILLHELINKLTLACFFLSFNRPHVQDDVAMMATLCCSTVCCRCRKIS